jgi:hypothetical protein
MKKLLLFLLVLAHGSVKSFDWMSLGLYTTACFLVGKLGQEEHKNIQLQKVEQQAKNIEVIALESTPIQNFASTKNMTDQEPVVLLGNDYSDNVYATAGIVCLLAATYGTYKISQWVYRYYKNYENKNVQHASA